MQLFNFLKKNKKTSAKKEKVHDSELPANIIKDKPQEKLLKPKIKLWKPRPTKNEKFFASDEVIVSKTDTKGNITYGNQLFISLSGYSEIDLLGQPHSIIRHPDMPRLIFKALWDTISTGKEINAYVINLARDGSLYWVFANVTPSFDENMNVIGYYSVRRKPNPRAIDIIRPFYESLKKAEAIGGTHESTKELLKLLKSKNMSYEELVYYLQYNI